jgi:hypothetical protein
VALSSPNAMVWNYFRTLRRLVDGIQNSDADADTKRQDIALVILMSVTVVEAFFNIFFRVVVSEPGFQAHEEKVKKRTTLDSKFKEWPLKILGSGIDVNTGIGHDFLRLKERRNQLMHFTSTHTSLQLGGIVIEGVCDTSIYDELSPDDARAALATAEGVIEAILRIRGVTNMPLAMRQWAGGTL